MTDEERLACGVSFHELFREKFREYKLKNKDISISDAKDILQELANLPKQELSTPQSLHPCNCNICPYCGGRRIPQTFYPPNYPYYYPSYYPEYYKTLPPYYLTYGNTCENQGKG